VYNQNGLPTEEQGDGMFKEIKNNINSYRNYMRDFTLFAPPTYDLTWTNMLLFLYNGTSFAFNYTSNNVVYTAGNAGQFSNWTGEQILGSYKFNYQLNTGTVC
jgi:hypothetical protein